MVNFTTSIKLSGGYIQMKNTAINLQDLFLNNARKERIPVTIYLMNGVKVNGQVKGFDSYIICLLYTSPSPRDRQKSRMPSSA